MMKEPEKIMKKNILNGQIKYQVKWKGFDETTWESDETMKKYKELIEDYNYFSLTGERYDEKKLEEIRQLTVQSQPRTAIKRVAMPKLTPPSELNKKEKKIDKIDSKHIEIIDNPKNDQQQDKVNIIQPSNTTINLPETNKNATEKLANSNDKLEIVKLQSNENKGLFSLIWKQRSDGIQPYCDEYSYEDFKTQAPLFFIQFFEACIFECQSQNDVKFEIQGQDMAERIKVIKDILEQNDSDKKISQIQK
ncbi:unnamed protein product (macronuclear) [Paramecium tetraurelia]|uniref:Chromo domain-containing protein n=1 Tax=Paramecium tetraurelia TaxID=5888 RepID=A0BPC3_PARTE|nr:uncharacterized protein GSPATT00005139001 [Paramecium tetraurelia]CAK60390.1 unnamed protein product [Paramecium tetraurelia]|eukprot:XP_001427788.1 hypothetical protein (macronuclear) [Paramecium tetraurelia strain d4-2]